MNRALIASLEYPLPATSRLREGPRAASVRQVAALNYKGGLADCLAIDAARGIPYITAKTAWQWLHELTMAHEAEKDLERMGAKSAEGEAHPPEA